MVIFSSQFFCEDMQKIYNIYNFSITFYYTFLRVQLKTLGFWDE